MKIGKRYISVKLIVFICIVLVLYAVFAATRYSEYTTYIPLAGKVFHIDTEDVAYIRFVNGFGEEVVFESPEEVEIAAEMLESFHYWFCLPGKPPIFGGYQYFVQIMGKDGSYVNYEYGGCWLEARGVRYFGSTADLTGLFADG